MITAVGDGTTRVVLQDARLRDSQHIKIPHLRGLYQKTGFTNKPGAASLAGFGFIHDGRDSTLFDHFGAARFLVLTNNSVVKSNLAALLLCFDTGTPPALGYFRPATTNYVTDKTGVGPFTHAELAAKVMAGDTLSIMGAPPVSGIRMGLDRDGVGDLDGDVVPPPLRITLGSGSIRISWTNASGVVLEVADTLSTGQWRTDTVIRETIGNETTVTHLLPASNRFYRLRGL